MAKHVHQLIVAAAAHVTAAFPAQLTAVATELGESIDGLAAVFTERRTFSRQYPHIQVYPIDTQFPEESNQNAVEGISVLHFDAHIRAMDEATVELWARAYVRALDDILRCETFSGLTYEPIIRRHQYFDAESGPKSGFIGGGRVIAAYEMPEPLTVL